MLTRSQLHRPVKMIGLQNFPLFAIHGHCPSGKVGVIQNQKPVPLLTGLDGDMIGSVYHLLDLSLKVIGRLEFDRLGQQDFLERIERCGVVSIKNRFFFQDPHFGSKVGPGQSVLQQAKRPSTRVFVRGESPAPRLV